jgi:hypothetical protein
MVNENRFKDWLQDLGDNFGVRGDMLSAKTRLFWNEFKAVRDDIWESACRGILNGEERFPTISRMKGFLVDAVRRMVGPERAVTPCDRCDGSGYISTVKQCGTFKGQPLWSDWSFRCPCDNGAFMSKRIPIWEEAYRLQGYVTKVEYDGLGGFELEDGDYVAPHEEQRVRMEMVREIERLIATGDKGKAQDMLCKLDERIDCFRRMAKK